MAGQVDAWVSAKPAEPRIIGSDISSAPALGLATIDPGEPEELPPLLTPGALTGMEGSSGEYPRPLPGRWVVDTIELQPPDLGTFIRPVPTFSIAETLAAHSSLEEAQEIPIANEIQIHGATDVNAPADVYRVPLDRRGSSITVSLANDGTASRGERHIQMMDDAGNIYCDLKVDDPTAVLRITMHPRDPSAEHALYMSVFTTANMDTTTPETDFYSLFVIQQTPTQSTLPTESAGQSGMLIEDFASTSTTLDASGVSIIWDFQPKGDSTRPESATGEVESLELGQVANQGSALTLPSRIVSPEGGILTLGEGTAAFAPSAFAVDLALLDLDSAGDSVVDPDAYIAYPAIPTGNADRSERGAGLPLAMLGYPDIAMDARGVSKEAAPGDTPTIEHVHVKAIPLGKTATPRRWGLLQTGVGVASALAFALLMPDATLWFQEEKPRRRLRSPDGAERVEDCGR